MTDEVRSEEMSGARQPTTYLVAQDFSPCADLAAEVAAKEAALRGGRLVLLHVTTLPPAPLGFEWIASRKMYPAWQEMRGANLDTSLERLRSRAAAIREAHPGITVEEEVREGFPAEVILAVAQKVGADFIVLGTHGKKRITKLLLGSVTEKVVRLAEQPVLIVKDPAGHAADEDD